MLSQDHPRLYQWVKPRSLGLHALFLVIAAGCLVAAWWQVTRAAQGNTLSYFYAIEWPAWWQMFHDTPEDIAARRAHHVRMRRASAEVVARTLPRSALAVTVGSTELDGRALGASPRAALGGGTAGGTSLPDGPGAELVLRPPGAVAATGRPGTDAVMLLPAEDPDGAGVEATDEMDDYNRYLALLAVRGRAKTWRNPRGV
jgi:hypothetical protein